MEKFYLDMTDEEFDKYYLSGIPACIPLFREIYKDRTPDELREQAANILFDEYGASAEYEWLMKEATRREVKQWQKKWGIIN